MQLKCQKFGSETLFETKERNWSKFQISSEGFDFEDDSNAQLVPTQKRYIYERVTISQNEKTICSCASWSHKRKLRETDMGK